MSDTALAGFDVPEDGFESFYAEKLWHWIPEIYRTLDLDPPNPGVLRALIEIVATQAAVLRRDIDRVWDDQAIELCDAWAISYLGQLVGAFDVSDFNERGNRLATARAIYYQRRKGTLGVMHDLIRDIAGVEGVVVEAFRRLVRFPHRLDSDAIGRGRVTDSPTGGLIDLRSPRVKGLHDTGFDEGAHFPDIRRLRGPYGRYGIRKVNVHLYPLRSYPVALPTPVQIGPGRYTLDPSGRDVPLFQRGQTSDRAPDQIRAVDLPQAILCRRFNAARHRITPATLAEINDTDLDLTLAPLLGVTFRDTGSLRRVLDARLEQEFIPALLDATMLPDSEKAVLWGDSLSLTVGSDSRADPLVPAAVVAAALDRWETGLVPEDFHALAFDPDTGRVIDRPDRPNDGEMFAVLLHYGQFAPLGAGTYNRAGGLSDAPDTEFGGGTIDSPGPETVNLAGALPTTEPRVIRFTTSKTYSPSLSEDRLFNIDHNTVIEADDGERPYVLFRPPAMSLDITFRATGEEPDLVIDGLWIGLLAEVPTHEDTTDPASPVTARLILDGDFGTVTLRNMTLDPGGERARAEPDQVIAIPYVQLEIEGQVEKLEILSCITGPLIETNADAELCNAGIIQICDSVVQSIGSGPAIRTRLGHVHLIRSTVFGPVQVAQLHASDSIIDGQVRVSDTQNGCVRYSATGEGETAVLPRQFESVVLNGPLPPHWIASRRFGDPWFAALSNTAPEAIARGGSNGAEMGVFNSRGLAVLLNDLAAAVPQLMPVGQTPQYILEREGMP